MSKVANHCYGQNTDKTAQLRPLNDDMDLLCVMRCMIGLVENNFGKIDHILPRMINHCMMLNQSKQASGY